MLSKDQINAISEMLRWITPTAIAVFGFISVSYLGSIDKRFEQIDSKFNTFLDSYHAIEKRVNKLEYRVFGQQDGGQKWQ